MIEGEDDTSSVPKRKGRHFWGGLDQLGGWPPGWFSWSSDLKDVMSMTDKNDEIHIQYLITGPNNETTIIVFPVPVSLIGPDEKISQSQSRSQW